MEYLKVEGDNSLIRDMDSKAIINTDRSAYQNYIERKNAVKNQKAEIMRQAEELNNVKNELCEIKELLLTLISKR